jgi:hypothetical protein
MNPRAEKTLIQLLDQLDRVAETLDGVAPNLVSFDPPRRSDWGALRAYRARSHEAELKDRANLLETRLRVLEGQVEKLRDGARDHELRISRIEEEEYEQW